MSGADKRLDRLYPGLTVRQRGLLMLQAVKEDRDVEPAVWQMVPPGQAAEYGRLVRLVNAINVELASVIFILHEQAEKVALRLAWLQTVQLWGSEVQVLGRLVLAQQQGVAVGVRRDVRKLLKRAPSLKALPFDPKQPVAPAAPHGSGFGDELARALAVGTCQSLMQHWSEIRSIEVVLDEVRDEFEGEDALHPGVRQLLDAAKQNLVDVGAGVAPYAGKIELADPGDDDVELVRKLIAKASKG